MNVTHFTLPRASVEKLKKINRFRSSILFMYKENVMPWLTITTVPLVIITFVIGIMLIKYRIFNRVEAMNSMLTESLKK